jgi:hypothetical protein
MHLLMSSAEVRANPLVQFPCGTGRSGSLCDVRRSSKKYDRVLEPVIGYSSTDRLIEVLEDKIVRPANRATGLFLTHACAVNGVALGRNVVDPYRDKVAAPELYRSRD